MVPEGAAKWCTGVAEWPEGPKYCLTSVLLNARETKKSKTFQVVNLSVQNVLENCYICDCVFACSKYGKYLGCPVCIHPVPALGGVRSFSDEIHPWGDVAGNPSQQCNEY